MSLNSLLIMGVHPLGDSPAAVLISGIGAPLTVLISATLVGVYAVYLIVAWS